MNGVGTTATAKKRRRRLLQNSSFLSSHYLQLAAAFAAGCVFGSTYSVRRQQPLTASAPATTTAFLKKQQSQQAQATRSDDNDSRLLIRHLDDVPFRKTSHTDQKGGSIWKQQFIEPFEVLDNLAGISVGTIGGRVAGSAGAAATGEEHQLQIVPEHSHTTMHEFFYVLKGSGYVTLDGKDYSLKEGSFIHVPPSVRHGFRNTQVGQETEEDGRGTGGEPLVLLNTAVTTVPGPPDAPSR